MSSIPVTLRPAEFEDLGRSMYALIATLYPICRSITGDGVRKSLGLLQEKIPLSIHEVPTGTEVFDWTIPKEWNAKGAWIKDSAGNTIVDFADHNLHLLNYSTPVHKTMTRDELIPHLHSLPNQPDLIPYKTSYYNETWGFCLAHNVLKKLPHDNYEVFIDTTLAAGSLSYGELFIPGESEEEILFSSHICHPSLANDNLAGISVMAHLAERLSKRKNRYSYRFIWIPATIGAITWLAQNRDIVPRIKFGMVGSLLGDPADFTYKKTRQSSSELDYLVPYALEQAGYPYKTIEFSPYGYDERQFSSPGFDMEVGSLTRSEYGSFPEYHTSADNLNFVKKNSLAESLDAFSHIVDLIERNQYYISHAPYGEPQLGKRGLYGTLGGNRDDVNDMMAKLWLLNSADGKRGLFSTAQKSGIPYETLQDVADLLIEKGLISQV